MKCFPAGGCIFKFVKQSQYCRPRRLGLVSRLKINRFFFFTLRATSPSASHVNRMYKCTDITQTRSFSNYTEVMLVPLPNQTERSVRVRYEGRKCVPLFALMFTFEGRMVGWFPDLHRPMSTTLSKTNICKINNKAYIWQRWRGSSWRVTVPSRTRVSNSRPECQIRFKRFFSML